MGKQKAMDKLFKEFERAQGAFLGSESDDEPEPQERDDLTEYKTRALRYVCDELLSLRDLGGDCALDKPECEICLGMRTMAASEIVGRCLARLSALTEVEEELG